MAPKRIWSVDGVGCWKLRILAPNIGRSFRIPKASWWPANMVPWTTSKGGGCASSLRSWWLCWGMFQPASWFQYFFIDGLCLQASSWCDLLKVFIGETIYRCSNFASQLGLRFELLPEKLGASEAICAARFELHLGDAFGVSMAGVLLVALLSSWIVSTNSAKSPLFVGVLLLQWSQQSFDSSSLGGWFFVKRFDYMCAACSFLDEKICS